MTGRLAIATGFLLAVCQASASLEAAAEGLPLRNGRPVVATVNDAVISLDELAMQLGPGADRALLRQGRGTARDLELLDRLITIKLIVQEATTMGLDELPEIRKQVEVSSREILREVLIERLVKDVKPDPTAVERRFKDMVREWKTTSLLFQDEAAAHAARKQIASGAAFADVAARALAARTARADTDEGYHAKTDYLPQIAEAIATLRVGQVSPVIRLQAGFAIVEVADTRHPANAAARAAARTEVLKREQLAFLERHEQAMRRQYVVVDEGLLKSLDYTASTSDLSAWLKDKRVVAQIKGAESITVGDLTDYLRMQFFHGTDQARQRKEMNEKKGAALDATLGRRLLNREARMLRIDRTNAYRDRVNGYRESLIFDGFVQKVIVPENKMKEEEVRKYYDGHLKEYSYPEMLKARSLAFTARGAAETAIRKLRDGTDYGWLAANAEGQVAKGTAGLLALDGRPVMTGSLPQGVQKALDGAKAGDHTLYAGPDGHFYVVSIQQAIAANPKPYQDVRQEIAKTLYGEKLKKAVADYAHKLRAHSKVATYLKRVQ